jgi:cell division protein FtsQ
LGGGWIVALSIVALLILSVGVSVSPAVAVHTITISGVSGTQRAEAQKALASLKGQPLPQIGAETIRARLDNSPWVQSFTFAAVLPHELSVHLTARTPVGVFASGKWFLLVDAAGVAISKTTSAPAGYPILATPDTDPGSAAFAAAVKVSRSLDTGLRATVQRISASSSDDVTLLIEGGVDVVWGDASQSTQKAAVLAALRKAVPDAKHLDVSSPKAPVSS